MRRSSVVKLTLLPMLATAAVASIAAADPPSIADDPPPMEPIVPTATASASVSVTSAPGQVEAQPRLSPPGMTPTIYELACEDDPQWYLRSDCVDEGGGYYYEGGVIRGGFGGYFYGGGGG